MKFGNVIATIESADAGTLDATEDSIDDEPIETLTGQESVPNEEPVTSGEAIEEITEASEETIAVSGQLEEEFKAASALDEIQRTGNEVIQVHGNLTPLTSTVIKTTMESIYSKLNMEYTPMPSLESFKGTHTKKEATKVTMEGILSTGKSLGLRIIAAIKALLSSTLSFLGRIFANRTLLEKRLVSLNERYKKLPAAPTPKSDKISGRFANGLKALDNSDFQSVTRILNSAIDLNKTYEDAVNTIDAIRYERPNPDKNLRAHMGKPVATGNYGDDKILLYHYLTNGKSLTPIEDTHNEGAVVKLEYFSNCMNTDVHFNDMTAPSSSEIGTVISLALTAVRKLRATESKSSTLTSAVKDLIRKLEEAYSELGSDLGSEKHTARKIELEKARNSQKLINTLVARLPMFIFSAINHAANYADAGLRNLEAS